MKTLVDLLNVELDPFISHLSKMFPLLAAAGAVKVTVVLWS
jgi:hypothetical protein